MVYILPSNLAKLVLFDILSRAPHPMLSHYEYAETLLRVSVVYPDHQPFACYSLRNHLPYKPRLSPTL